MYIYHALINALSTHMIHINLNMIFYTHVEHSPTKTIYIKYWHHLCSVIGIISVLSLASSLFCHWHHLCPVVTIVTCHGSKCLDHSVTRHHTAMPHSAIFGHHHCHQQNNWQGSMYFFLKTMYGICKHVKKWVRFNHFHNLVKCVNPVSYTHLTLPTSVYV